jgi:hypothetical protein
MGRDGASGWLAFTPIVLRKRTAAGTSRVLASGVLERADANPGWRGSMRPFPGLSRGPDEDGRALAKRALGGAYARETGVPKARDLRSDVFRGKPRT